MPPLLSALSFLVIATDEIAEWREFGTRVVAMMLCEGGEGGGGSGGGGDSELVFRMDERAARWIVTKEEGENCIGWDADAAAEDLEPVKAALASLGIAFRDLTADECTRRKVASGISFKDPEGNTHNVVLGAAAAPAAAPFAPARAISGFRTADMGMGHCVLHVKDTERMKPFVKALGFKLTDYAESPFKAHFYHLNARHHSLAMIETGKSGIHHIMLEYTALDDVGQSHDLVPPQKIGTTLGRHTNDFVTSFYAITPSSFLLELGWGGRILPESGWEVKQLLYGPSLWGHDRNWLSPEQMDAARAVRQKAAETGLRVPVQVKEGGYNVGPPPEPWWEVDARRPGYE